MRGGRKSGAHRNPGRVPPHVYTSLFTLRRALATTPPYSTVMLKEKSRVSPGSDDGDVAFVLKHVILAGERGVAGPGLERDKRRVALARGPDTDVLEIREVDAHAAAALGAAQGERAVGDVP